MHSKLTRHSGWSTTLLTVRLWVLLALSEDHLDLSVALSALASQLAFASSIPLAKVSLARSQLALWPWHLHLLWQQALPGAVKVMQQQQEQALALLFGPT